MRASASMGFSTVAAASDAPWFPEMEYRQTIRDNESTKYTRGVAKFDSRVANRRQQQDGRSPGYQKDRMPTRSDGSTVDMSLVAALATNSGIERGRSYLLTQQC